MRNLTPAPRTALVARDGGGAPQHASALLAVPLNRKSLAPAPPGRVRRLRQHLVEALRAERTLPRKERWAAPPSPEPDGFAGEVARTACTLCQGWCCKGGEEHAYLDERTMARVRRARPELDARGILRLYSEQVPASAYAGSCIFHSALGCTLDRTLRSDLCNSYYCAALGQFVAHAEDTRSVTVIAGDASPAARNTRQPETAASSPPPLAG